MKSEMCLKCHVEKIKNSSTEEWHQLPLLVLKSALALEAVQGRKRGCNKDYDNTVLKTHA